VKASWLLGGALLTVIVLPLLALVLGSSPSEVLAGIKHPLFAPALWLSLRTSVLSVVLVVLTGTPLALMLSRAPPSLRWVQALVELPIVVPPAVVGVGLLQAFGRQGLLGPALASVGLSLPFTSWAVVMAQVVVASPFYVSAAVVAFRRIDPDLLLVARTLGASPTRAFMRVALPVAAPGLVAGAAMCWARALGEFGATLLFAGNLGGVTQTMPLAIFSALETDLSVAVALSLALAATALVALAGLRLGSSS
jgi:molybdate transport system permease protein